MLWQGPSSKNSLKIKAWENLYFLHKNSGQAEESLVCMSFFSELYQVFRIVSSFVFCMSFQIKPFFAKLEEAEGPLVLPLQGDFFNLIFHPFWSKPSNYIKNRTSPQSQILLLYMVWNYGCPVKHWLSPRSY